MKRVGWALCAVGLVVAACSSDDRPPLAVATPGGNGGSGSGAATGDGGEPARVADGGPDADAAFDAGPVVTCHCECRGKVRFGAVMISLELPCGGSLCVSGQLHSCSVGCSLTTSRC